MGPPTDVRTRHSPSRRVRFVVPPQHGAWAMLLVPYLLGTVAAGWTVAAVPLLLVWLMGYLFSYSALMAVRVRRRERYIAAARLTGLLAVPFGIWLLVLQPWVALAAVAFVPMALVNIRFARRHDERSWANGLASVTQACLMVPLAYGVGQGSDWARAAALFAIAWLYFAGTVFYVKTMIRGRGDRGFLRASLAFHAAAVVAATLVSVELGVLFGWFLLRAWAMPRIALNHRVKPVHVGVLEMANSVLLVAVALITT